MFVTILTCLLTGSAYAAPQSATDLLTPDTVVVGALHVRSAATGKHAISYGTVGPRWLLAASDKAALVTGVDFEIAPGSGYGNFGLVVPVVGLLSMSEHHSWSMGLVGVHDVSEDGVSYTGSVVTGPFFRVGDYGIPLTVGTGVNKNGWTGGINIFTGVVIPLP